MRWHVPAFLLISFCLASLCVAWDWDALQRVAQAQFGAGAMPTLKAWRVLLQDARPQPINEKLSRVNLFFNERIRFVDDIETWGQADYWATPLETIGRGAGDCEDFAIAKYFSLRELGVPEQELRLVYVKARIGGAASTLEQAHMVLVWYASPSADPLVLDNLISEVRPASRRPDLKPVFSFNAEGIYVGNTRTNESGLNRLSRWQDLLERARQQGLTPSIERKSP